MAGEGIYRQGVTGWTNVSPTNFHGNGRCSAVHHGTAKGDVAGSLPRRFRQKDLPCRHRMDIMPEVCTESSLPIEQVKTVGPVLKIILGKELDSDEGFQRTSYVILRPVYGCGVKGRGAGSANYCHSLGYSIMCTRQSAQGVPSYVG